MLFEDNRYIASPLFTAKVNDIATRLQINPNWLMWVMNNESGLNPKAQNLKYLVHGQPATGLIQFVDTTASNLGTSIPQLYSMGALNQLDYVYKYFKPYAGKIKSLYDLYLITFFPVALGKSDSWIFETKKISRASIAKANPFFDLNKDGMITIAEFKEAINKKIRPEHKPLLLTAIGGAGKVVTVLIIASALTYAVKKFIL
jgi:hypothetical protein